MIITLIQNDPLTAPLTISVSQDGAEAVIGAMAMDGWHVLTKHYGPAAPIVDCLQVALLEVSGLPEDAPMRVAVELGASAAMLGAPVEASGPAQHATGSRSGGGQRRISRAGKSVQSSTAQGKDVIH